MSKEPTKREDLSKSEQDQPAKQPTERPPSDKLEELRATGELLAAS